MWNDNETDIDLLGFEYLVDSLDILLSEPGLLPLTVGVLGDWGSGKSSLMRIAKARLDGRSAAARRAVEACEEGDAAAVAAGRPFITVAFSPWRFEDYTQVKFALMDAVLDAIEDHIAECAPESEPKTKLAKARRFFRPLRRFRSAVAPAATAGATAGAAALGLPPEAGAVVGAGADALLPAANPERNGDEQPEPDIIESVAQFHLAFEDLLESIEDVQAVVVFIDDMDRCAESAIIDTFETIRLFLHAPKTAFVLGLNEPIIIAALEARYPERTAADDSRAQQYLEKMIQASVSIPALSEPEVRTYVSLLFAAKHLPPDQFDKLLARVEEERARNPNGELMNLGIARATLDLGEEFPKNLERDLEIAASAGGPLASGLRGNPRQVKRFLNRLQLRLRVAEKRAIPLDPEVLSKLMVLEETSFSNFETLFVWQIDHDGRPPHVEIAEAVAQGQRPPKADADIVREATEWAEQPKVQAWLNSKPSLVGQALGGYFTFSRDRLTTSVRAARLSPEQQKLLASLQDPTEPLRKTGVETALENPLELPAVVDVLLEEFPASVSSKGSRSLVEIAGRHPGTAIALFEELQKLPVTKITAPLALHLAAQLGGDTRLPDLIAAWQSTGKLPEAAKRGFDAYNKKKSQ